MTQENSLDKEREGSSISFQDDRSKNGSEESFDTSSSSRTVQLTGRSSPQTAPNVVKGTQCLACCKDVCLDK